MLSRRPLRYAVALLLLVGCQQRSAAPSQQAAGPPAHSAAEPAGAMAALPATVADWATGARLLDGLGSFHRGVTTDSSQAQLYFDQGMRLLWAFNHDESSRSFARAAQLDPKCASCYWGLALTVGPNYNLPSMAKARAKVAVEALELAQKHAAGAQPVERALIAALASRYPSAEPLDEQGAAPVLTAYANAMRLVAQSFPEDLDVQTLFAESMMNTNAWKLWTPDGRAAPGTHEIRVTLERVLLHDPRHPGANHYYVHTMEASPHPDLALGAAERLRGMMPAAGHLEHMPAHILQRLGRYEDAAQANRTGAALDEAYFKLARPLDYYPLIYTAHNYQFLAFSTAMEGRKAETLEAVRNARRVSADDQLRQMPAMQWQLSEEYAALLRFGLWDDMLARPAPDPAMASLTGGYLYARGVALAATGRVEDAQKTLAELRSLIGRLAPDSSAGMNTARDVLELAALLVQARIAAAQRHGNDAIALLRDATAREDRLAYNEPADWFFPVRHTLGAQLLEAGQPAAAEAVLREDLKRNPANGWALFSLAEALKRQRKTVEAQQAQRQFQQAWSHSDITLASSAF